MHAHTLYKRHSKAELLALQEQVEQDPENKAEAGSIFLHSGRARKLLENIATAISYHMADERAARGSPVPVSGYSGRQTNRKR